MRVALVDVLLQLAQRREEALACHECSAVENRGRERGKAWRDMRVGAACGVRAGVMGSVTRQGKDIRKRPVWNRMHSMMVHTLALAWKHTSWAVRHNARTPAHLGCAAGQPPPPVDLETYLATVPLAPRVGRDRSAGPARR